MEHLNESTFLLKAMHSYDVPCCTNLEEFNEDLKRFGLLSRLVKNKEINIQLLLNHLIILYNVFGNSATDLILFKIEKQYWKYILPCMIYLNRLDEKRINEYILESGPLDVDLIERLKKL